MNILVEFLEALGLERLNFGEPVGFYGTEVYLMVTLFGGVYAAMLGAGLLAKEEDEKTIEFLLARPVSRTSVLTQKLLTYVLYLVAFNAVIGLVGWASFAVFVDQPYSGKALLLLTVAPIFLHLALASVGFLSALFWKRRRALYSVAIGLVVGTYFLGVISRLNERLEWLGWLSPFRYVEAADIVGSKSLNPGYIAVLLGVSAVAVAAAFVLYRRRDITV